MNGQSNSLYLPGPINYVAVGDLDVAGDQLTVEALINYTGNSVNVVSKHTGPANVNYLLRIGSFEITTTNGFAAFGGVAAAGVNLVMGETYHIAATYNGQFLRYYVNGCMTGEMPWTGNMVQNNLITAIGQQSACQCEQYTGYIDEVRIWNVARTQQEIADNMLNLPNPTTTAGLLAYYKFDGNFVNNQGNLAWDGTPVGNPQLNLIPDPYPQAMNMSASASDPLCNNEGNGVIDAAGSGAYLPYEYSLDGVNFTSSSTFQNLSSGNYTVYTRPENNNNCMVSDDLTINNPAPIESNITTTDVTCFGGSNGEATLSPSGGNGPDFTHTWTPNTTTNLTVDNLAEGNYSVDISDSCKTFGRELVVNGHFENGYTDYTTNYTEGLYAGQIGGGEYAVSFDPSLYHSGFVGSGAGGSGNFMIVNSSSIANQEVWCQSIPVNPNMFYNFSLLISSLFTVSPAELEILINGVPLPTHAFAPGATNVWDLYEESWFSGGATLANICIINTNTAVNGNDFGIDNISFKECASCTETFPFTINEPTELTMTSTVIEESCSGASDGEIEINANGGTGVLAYSIDNGVTFQNNATFDNLVAGNYDVVDRDGSNCEISAVVNVTVLPSLNFDINIVDPLCHDGNTGSVAIVNVVGGTSPYTYSIDNGTVFQGNGLFNNQTSGIYDVVVSDSNGCEVTDQIVLTDPSEITFGFNFVPPSCAGASDGEIEINATGGTGPLTYSIDNGVSFQSSNEFMNLSSGNYTIVIRDGSGCEKTDNIAINSPAPISFHVSISNLTCFDDNTGKIEFINVAGGSSNYVFSIDGGVSFQNNSLFPNLPAGSYDLFVRDGNGCTSTNIVNLTQPDVLEVEPILIDVSCFGACDGVLGASVSGGNAPYTHFWTGEGVEVSAFELTDVCSGEYNLLVRDDNGCTVSQSLLVDEPDEVIANFYTEQTDVSILDTEVDFINTSIGATHYIWSFDDASPLSNSIHPTHVFPEEPADYSVKLIAINASGCSDTVVGVIKINDELIFYIPNAFTPDGNLVNSTFVPEFYSGYAPEDYNFMIFNRWGEVVFKTNSPNSGWDGTYQGKKAVEGTYVWKIEFSETMSDHRYVHSGHVTLLR